MERLNVAIVWMASPWRWIAIGMASWSGWVVIRIGCHWYGITVKMASLSGRWQHRTGVRVGGGGRGDKMSSFQWKIHHNNVILKGRKKNLLNHSVHPKPIGLVGSLVKPLIPMVRGRFKSCLTHRCEPDRNGDRAV